MFLNQLNQEEKNAFLELAHYIARSDNDFSDDEKSIIEKYCMEMQIDNIDYDKKAFDIYNTLGKIKHKRSQKIVLLEIMALIYADDLMHPNEEKVLMKMLEEFDIHLPQFIICTEWAKTMLSLYRQGKAVIDL